jgi:hypothetical protein
MWVISGGGYKTLEARSARYLMHLSDIAQLRAAAANLMMASSLRIPALHEHTQIESKSRRYNTRSPYLSA